MPFRFLASVLWKPAIDARNYLYDRGLLPVRRLRSPVISIGNLTLGGTGKTPLVIHVARLIIRLGKAPVLLSRGYKRRRSTPMTILPPGAAAERPAADLGDEAALVRIHVPEIWLGISPDRYRAGSAIERALSDAVIILDDGFQHRKLKRDLDVVLIDPTQPLADNRIFPRGSLREPVTAVRRCHAVVINGDPAEAGPAEIRKCIAQLKADGLIFHCIQQISSLKPLAGRVSGTITPAGEGDPVFLVAAIGNPQRFRRDVEGLKLEIRGCRFFRDHHELRPQEWEACWREASSRGARYMLTTEKDVVKLDREPGFPLYVAVQSTHVVETELFEDLVRRCVG
ncbi:MAG: tetraacyldisaccharide 4'-kinase [Acidobacteria bacterium]|nr:tetraacyldisaccharide 4'-kinase [Acidobacteriota bacterium]